MFTWLNKNKQFLSIRAIEEAIGMPHDTLQKALLGTQNLPKKWIGPLKKWIKNFIEISWRD
jgi:hypothetical protein